MQPCTQHFSFPFLLYYVLRKHHNRYFHYLWRTVQPLSATVSWIFFWRQHGPFCGVLPDSYTNNQINKQVKVLLKEIWTPALTWQRRNPATCRPAAYLESRCSCNSRAALSRPPPPPPPPHGGNKADSAPQLLRWPAWDTRCSWLDRAPNTPDRSCRSLHKRGLNPDDVRENEHARRRHDIYVATTEF